MDFLLAKGSDSNVQRAATSMQPRTIIARYDKVRVWDQTAKQYIYKAVPVYKVVYRVDNLPPAQSVAATTGEEYAALLGENSLDIEIGGQNDFELKIDRVYSEGFGIDFGDYLFSPGTEWGGRIESMEIGTDTTEIVWQGITWRGLMAAAIIQPEPGQDYYTASGDLNEVIKQVLTANDDATVIFSVPDEAAGVQVTNYQFDRYTTKLAGLNKLLQANGYRLDIYTEEDTPGGTFKVWAQAVPITDYTEQLEYSQDTDTVTIRMTEDHGAVNHLICLGTGELKNRLRVDLYVGVDGSIIEDSGQGFAGISERAAVYDYNNVEGTTDQERLANLKAAGIKKLQEMQAATTMELTAADNLPAEIGDIVGGQDQTTGLAMSRPVSSKIYRREAGVEKITSSVNTEEQENANY